MHLSFIQRIKKNSSGELNDLFTTNPLRNLTTAGLGCSNAKLFPKGSLLIGMYDTAALKMSVLDRNGAFNQAIAGVKRCSNSILKSSDIENRPMYDMEDFPALLLLGDKRTP